MYIGNTLKSIRKAKRISLTELSQKSGVQIATLSRIENMKMVGTLESHIQIATALSIDVTDLYKDIDKQKALAEFGDQLNAPDIFTHSDHCSYEILTKHVLNKKMMPILIRIDPNGKTNTEQYKLGSERFIFVLEGSIEIQVENKKYMLNKNKTLYFDSSLSHIMANLGKSTAKILCIGAPVSL